jgi:hypothetical protein
MTRDSARRDRAHDPLAVTELIGSSLSGARGDRAFGYDFASQKPGDEGCDPGPEPGRLAGASEIGQMHCVARISLCKLHPAKPSELDHGSWRNAHFFLSVAIACLCLGFFAGTA